MESNMGKQRCITFILNVFAIFGIQGHFVHPLKDKGIKIPRRDMKAIVGGMRPQQVFSAFSRKRPKLIY